MSMFTVNGVVEAASGSASSKIRSLEKLGLALLERFDVVDVGDRSVEASVTSLMALTFRGPRTHPMLPFERVRLEQDDLIPNRLAFTLNFKMQVVIAAYLAIAFGLSASIDRGLTSGLAVGVAFAAALFVFNHLISRHRASKWLAIEWAKARA